ncbi:MAG: HAMP domain-containing protein [Candidatus Binatia bacterium]
MNAQRTDQEERRRQTAAQRQDHTPLGAPSAGSLVCWGATAVVIAVLTIGGICVANGVSRIGQPFPGFLVLQNRIVVSIGRSHWSLSKTARILFAEIVGIENRPVADGAAIQSRAATFPVGTPVTYRLRKQADVFSEVVTIKRFTLADYLAVYGTYFAVGVCFALAGWWAFRRHRVMAPAVTAFFVFCQATALVLLTGGDLYGPYWFGTVYFTAFSVAPAALFHLASSFPEPIGYPSQWRRLALLLLYGCAMAVALAFYMLADGPSLFLPLLYTVYLLLANALLLYLARLLIYRLSGQGTSTRRDLGWALAGILISGLAAGTIFVAYPVLHRAISPVVLVAPLAIFPLLTAAALRRAPDSPPRPSVRLRLSLLLLGPVETAFLIGVAFFWLNTSRERLFNDFALNQHQQGLVQRFLDTAPTGGAGRLAAVEALVQTVSERTLVNSARAAVARGNLTAARQAMENLAQRYRDFQTHLQARRGWIDRLATALVLGLIVTGVGQAIAFMVAMRRWLIRPIERLAGATSVIATGDLSHRVEIASSDEFAMLAESINVMASSLGEIQRQVETAREGRRRAAGAARDAERHRLARELHDSVLQDLIAVKLRIEGVRKGSSGDLQPMIDDLVRITTDLRGVVNDLQPPDLSTVSLTAAVTAHAQLLTRAYGTPVQVDLPPEIPVPDWATRDVYRVAQESMTNAVRHGAPKRVVVRLSRQQTTAVLEIVDDGAGFDLRHTVMGSGVRGMRERAAALGTELQILTAPGAGAIVRLVLPAV